MSALGYLPRLLREQEGLLAQSFHIYKSVSQSFTAPITEEDREDHVKGNSE